jgi:hypothetical protein
MAIVSGQESRDQFPRSIKEFCGVKSPGRAFGSLERRLKRPGACVASREAGRGAF